MSKKNHLDYLNKTLKVTFGKFSAREKKLPASVEACHGLVEGFHSAKYLNEFQKQLDAE